MSHDVSKIGITRIFATIVLAGALIASVVLLFQAHAQSMRIEALERRVLSLQAQLATYDRTLCSHREEAPTGRTTHQYTIGSAGYDRTYRVDTPYNYDPSARYPVIISFDGIEGSGDRMKAYAKFDSLPVIMVYPDSLPGNRGFTAWQGAPYSEEGDRDVVFIRDVLATLPSHYCIDATQQFAVGMSNGGAFAEIIGCKLGGQIKAVASISGAFYTTCQQEERTPSLLVVHSTADGQVPFAGEVSRHLPKVQEWVSRQVVQRKCKVAVPEGKADGATYYEWRQCNDDSTLRFVVVHGQPHGWLTLPVVPRDSFKTTADYIWNFFQDTVYSQ